MSRIITVGSVAYDRIMDFRGRFEEHFLPDQLHKISVSFVVDTPTENFGGTAGNIAYSLALLGETPEIIANVGNDFARYRTWLTEQGIAHESIQEHADVPTAAAYIMTDTSDSQIAAFSPGAGGRAYAHERPLTGIALGIVSATFPDDVRAFPERFRAAGVPYLYDPGQIIPALTGDDLKAGIAGARALMVNDYELTMIREKTGLDEAGLLALTETLVVTLGAHGSRIVTAGGEESVAAVPVAKVVDPTGAGDAYRAGFIKGLLAMQPVSVCAQLGSTVAAYAVECYGTQNHSFTIEDIKNRFEKAYTATLQLS